MASLALITLCRGLNTVYDIEADTREPFFSLKGLQAKGILSATFRGPSPQHMWTLITSSQPGLLSSQGHMVRSEWLKGQRQI